MPNGIFVLMTMARNWDDAFMHATMIMLAKINAWTNLKRVNTTVPAKYHF